jgi:hypothetical protein
MGGFGKKFNLFPQERNAHHENRLQADSVKCVFFCAKTTNNDVFSMLVVSALSGESDEENSRTDGLRLNGL